MKRLRVFLANLGKHTFISPDSTPPLGILSLAAYLRSKLDVELLLVDQRVENATVESVVQRAADFRADVVGLGLMTYYAPMLGPVTQGLRAALPEAFQVLGGPHVSACQENALLGNVADAAVSGEGESSLEQIVRAHQAGADLTSVPGLLWRNGGGTIARNPGPPPLIEDVDTLPFLAYDLLDVRKYWGCRPTLTCRRANTCPSSAAGAARASARIVIRYSGNGFGRNRPSGWSPRSSIIQRPLG